MTNVSATEFGTCNITIDNTTPVELKFEKSKSKFDGVLSSDSPATVPAKASRVYKIIPVVGKTTSSGKLVYTINGATALVVEAECNPPILGLDADSKLASVATRANSDNTPENALVGTVSVSQATTEVASKEDILAEAASKAE